MKYKEVLQGKCVMMVDDNDVNLFALECALEDEVEMKIVKASSAEEAFEKLQSGTSIDVVLMDMMMPGISGYEAIQKIRESEKKSPRSLPIVAVTAQAMVGDRKKCLQAGADDYISKPVDVVLLIEVMAKCLNRR